MAANVWRKQLTSFTPPAWANKTKLFSKALPTHRIPLGNLPTPVHPFPVPGLPDDVNLYIKRDDFSGMEISGNKARKLEFLLADAIQQGADCIVTCGGVQSNHCRATAVAARMLGLDSYLLLRSSDNNTTSSDPGLVGNLLLDRLVDAKLIMLSKKDYASYGANAMIAKTCENLVKAGRTPYAIPVGGSNGIGTWGYISAVDEMTSQVSELEISDVAFACGSGGSSAGMALGFYLQSLSFRNKNSLDFSAQIPMHAYSVCDKPSYFYSHINNVILPDLGLDARTGIAAENFLQIRDVKGRGYAVSTDEELEFISSVARSTGVILDPVYSGKALLGFVKDICETPERFRGKNILFVHTGGLFGLYDKVSELERVLDIRPVERFQMD